MQDNIISIDLSLRSTGILYSNGITVKFRLIESDKKKHNDEILLSYNSNEIIKFIYDVCPQPDIIVIEGLSFNSISSSKDILAGNFWYVRTQLKKEFPKVKLLIVPVSEWRSVIFNKEERKQLTENKKELKKLEEDMKDLTSSQKKDMALYNEELILKSNIKYLCWEKIVEPYKTKFKEYGFKKGTFDLTDAFFINQYVRNTHENI